MISPWLGIALVMTCLGSFIAALKWFQTRNVAHPEVVRKCLHTTMGLVTLTFPWLFHEAWPVLLLAVLSVITLLSLRYIKFLRCSVGTVIDGVGRSSLGEVYFPIGIAILFHLYLHFQKIPPELMLASYVIPVLLLTFADTAAALIGIAYGKWFYSTTDGIKSAEGSLAFFLCAFVLVLFPLYIVAPTDPNLTLSRMLLIALLLAFLAMLFEAIAWGGLDNLLLPVVSFLLLRLYIQLPLADLLLRLAITSVLIGLLIGYQHRTTLIGNAVLGAFLVGYTAWSIAGWKWALAPITLFLVYTWFAPNTRRNQLRVHNLHAVMCVSSAGFVWLFLAKFLDRPEFLIPYTLSFAVHLAIIGLARLKNGYPQMHCCRLLAYCLASAFILILIPCFIIEYYTTSLDTFRLCCHVIIGILGILISLIAFFLTQPNLDDCPIDLSRWIRQGMHAGIGSGIALLSLYVV